MAPSRTLSSQSNSSTSICKRLDLSVLLSPSRLLLSLVAGFTPASCLTLCSSAHSWRVALKSVLQNYDARPEKKKLVFFLFFVFTKTSTFIENLFNKHTHLAQTASSGRKEEVLNFFLEWEGHMMKY